MIKLIENKNKVINAIREYFRQTRVMEVDTPILNTFPNLDPNIFPVEVSVEKSNEGKIRGFLHTSPEYNMKKVLSAIKKDIYQITHVFRNNEGSQRHSVEFRMLEWYRVGYDLDRLMEDTRNIFIKASEALYGKPEIFYNGKRYNLTDWKKITVEEAFYKYAGVDINSKKSLYNFLEKSSIKHTGISEEDFETNFYLIYSFYIEPNLGKESPTFIHDYPPEFSALAKIINGKGKRFEAYIGGLELVNGYYELNDPVELKKRLEKESRKTGLPVDANFIKISSRLPECSGASLGIDRLLMVLLNKKNIKQVQVLNWI